MDQPSQNKVDEAAMNGDTPAAYAAITYQPVALDMEKHSQATGNEAAANGDTPAEYAAVTTYQPVALASVPPSAGAAFLPASQGAPAYPAIPPPLSAQHQIAFQQLQQQQQQNQQEQLQAFWADQMAEIEQTTEFRFHSLPLARIKKIMKADEDVKMIAGEAPVVFAKACEMFILELTLRAWLHTETSKRRTLQRNDITAAITRDEVFDFLVDIIPEEELKVATVGMPPPPPLPPTAVPAMAPSYGPGMSIPFGMYANQQPVSFMLPLPEHLQQQQQQQSSDGGRDE